MGIDFVVVVLVSFCSVVESTESSDEDVECSFLVLLGFPIASIEVCINEVMVMLSNVKSR
ncbi:unnamed protein product [Candida parapsilosis]